MLVLRIAFGLCSAAAVLTIASTLAVFALTTYGDWREAANAVATVAVLAIFRLALVAYLARTWSARSFGCWVGAAMVAATIAFEAFSFMSSADRARGSADAASEAAARDAARAEARIAEIASQLAAVATVRTVARVAPEAEQARRLAPPATCAQRPHVDSCKAAAALDAELAEARRRDALEVERDGHLAKRDEAMRRSRPVDTQTRAAAELLGVTADTARRLLGLAVYLLLEVVASGGAAWAARVPEVPAPRTSREGRETPLVRPARVPRSPAGHSPAPIARNVYDVISDIATGALSEPTASVANGRVYMPVSSVARLAGVSRPTAGKRIAELESGGRLRIGRDRRGAWFELAKVARLTVASAP